MTINHAVERNTPARSRARLAMGLLVAFLPAGSAWASDTFKFDLSLDVIGADLGELDGLEPFKVDLAGLPLSLGASESNTGANPGLRAGMTGGYTLPLGTGFSVATTGSLKKTRHLEDSFFGSDWGAGRAAFRFERGSFRSMLEPGIEVDFLDGELDTRSYKLNGRVSRDVLPGLDMYLSSSLMRREYLFLPDKGADSNRAQGGLNYKIGEDARLTFSYDLNHKWATLPQDSTGSAGPSIGVNMTLAEALEIGATYRYCRNLAYALIGDALEERVDSLQSFGIKASWRDPEADYLTISADYGFERLESPVRDRGGDSHDGMVNMALQF